MEKVTVEINGRTFRVPRHMLEDLQRFGATQTKRVVKDPPPELSNMQPRKIVVPKVLKPEDALPEMKIEPEVKKRKSPVKSRTK